MHPKTAFEIAQESGFDETLPGFAVSSSAKRIWGVDECPRNHNPLLLAA